LITSHYFRSSRSVEHHITSDKYLVQHCIISKEYIVQHHIISEEVLVQHRIISEEDRVQYHITLGAAYYVEFMQRAPTTTLQIAFYVSI